jgi:hypothetical protein
LFTAHVRSGSPLSPVEFSSLHHSHKLSRSWLLGAHPCSHPLRPSPACLFTVPGRIPLPSFGAQCPTLFATCLYCSYCLLLRFSFFPGWGSVCLGGYADLATSSQAVWAWVTGGLGALLVSPFNVKWRCSAQAGGVEGSHLFLVALPARFVSSRRHAFCFLPLPHCNFLKGCLTQL